jgi:protein-S-isoprenylcysteine O-methyltransferase Ste14
VSVRKGDAALGSLVFLVLAPGSTGVLIPWLLTRWEVRVPPPSSAIRVLGLGLIVAGAAVLLGAFARFVLEGRGTPAPVAPTDRLVVRGLYCHVRNPMYLAVTATIVGQALFLGRWGLLVYALLFLGTTVAFVRWYEEPTLRNRFGAEYETYRRGVPGWWPRLTPWRPADVDAHLPQAQPIEKSTS